jgi:hypothetical protein
MTKAVDPDAIEDRIFSTSFSEDGDDLKQWVGYAGDAKGMALGFDLESIRMLEVPYFHHTPNGVLVRSSPCCVDGWGVDLGFCGVVVWLY